MLTGQAKVDYQREYMRRRRAMQPISRKPRVKTETKREAARRLRAEAEADRRMMADARWEARDEGWEYSNWPRVLQSCDLCERESDEVPLACYRYTHLCRDCAAKFVAVCDGEVIANFEREED